MHIFGQNGRNCKTYLFGTRICRQFRSQNVSIIDILVSQKIIVSLNNERSEAGLDIISEKPINGTFLLSFCRCLCQSLNQVNIKHFPRSGFIKICEY